MISLIKEGNLLDSEAALNPWESESKVHIICATNRHGISNDPNSVSFQLRDKYNAPIENKKWGLTHEIGGVFTTNDFNFWAQAQARAYAIVCHEWWDMESQNYSRAIQGLNDWLDEIFNNGLAINSISRDLALQELRESALNKLADTRANPLDTLTRLLQETQSRVNPLLRIPLMATWSPEYCRELLKVMQSSRTNLVLYLWARSVESVRATVLKFPWLFREVPALTQEELRLVA